jgi:hypothetical protein
VDGSVVAAVITSAAALVVAVGGGIRNDLRAATDRRYERRRAFLVEAQDAALALRDALREYGTALQEQSRTDTGATGSFTMAVPRTLNSATAVARGRLAVAVSRLEDATVATTLARWQSVARVSLIDPRDAEASAEQDAFDAVNAVIGDALHSTRGKLGWSARRRLGRDRAGSGRDV